MSDMTSQVILAGDIGGTKTRLALYRLSHSTLELLAEDVFQSRNYTGLEAILHDFQPKKVSVSAACFGIAGPAKGGVIRTTNLPWSVNTESLQGQIGSKEVHLINDLVANAYGIKALPMSDFHVLNKGMERSGNQAILSAGTGLGEAVLFWNGSEHIPSPSEGGHADFGPRTPIEIGLFQYLSDRFGHVSYERIVSGPGLLHIYEYLKGTRKFGDEPEWLSKRMGEHDPASVISEAALLRKNRICEEALDLFVAIYGAASGNLALHVMAVGGVYLGGGIAPKIIEKLKDGTFMEAFRSKGRFSTILAAIPVRVIMNEKTALLGAASFAASRLEGERSMENLSCGRALVNHETL